MKDLKMLAAKASAIAVYKKVINNTAIQAFLSMLDNTSGLNENYSLFYNALTNEVDSDNLFKYIEKLVLEDTNIFTRAAACGNIDTLSANIINAVRFELSVFNELATVTKKDISGTDYLPEFNNAPDIDCRLKSFSLENIEAFHKQYGYGEFIKSSAFVWDKNNSKCLPVINVNNINLSCLKEYCEEKQAVIDNTVNFLQGLPAQNVLLYGDRGTGKSSTVHAILNEYKDSGLRLIELNKHAVSDIKKISALVSGLKQKFIIFIDDLSFSESNDEFAGLKAVLEGSIEKHNNLLVYATTNRRHIIKENFSDRSGDELHISDTIEEQMSLSDRFGIVVTFINPSKAEFLSILKDILADRKIKISDNELALRAERYALGKGSRSPRAAKQLADIIEAEQKRK